MSGIILLILLILFVRFLFLATYYFKTTSLAAKYVTSDIVTYSIWETNTPFSVLHIGDLVGINIHSKRFLLSFIPPNDGNTHLIVPTLNPSNNAHISLDNVSNSRGVVLADNFCVKEWTAVANRNIYKNSILTPGPYCFSEQESVFIDQLIKKYNVKKIVIYADNKDYLNLIETFLTYIKEKNIHYSIKYWNQS